MSCTKFSCQSHLVAAIGYRFEDLQNQIKQVRTNIDLADTLIPSSVIYLIYMGGTGPYDLINIIFGYHVNS